MPSLSDLARDYYPESKHLQEAFKEGFRRGQAFAEDNIPKIGDLIDRTVDWIGLGKTVTAKNVRDYHSCLAHEAERHARQYSPFEDTAARLNGCDQPEEAWEAFEQGVNDGIAKIVNGFTLSDYGHKPKTAAPRGWRVVEGSDDGARA